jgi:hypothetical protein
MNNNVFFLDMEFGAIYGSCYKDYIPLEIGGIISNPKTDSLSSVNFVHHEFPYDGDVILRKSLTDDLGHTIGFSETVANTKRNEEQKKFDPSYILNSSDKIDRKKEAYRMSFKKLRDYFYDLIKKYNIKQLVFFGGSEDLKVLKKAHINISNLDILDIQHTIEQKLQYQFSLDKVSKVIEFYSNENSIGSTHFCYALPFPLKYRHVIKPHRAIGDGCRIFLVYQEFVRYPQAFIEKSTHHLQKIAKREAKKVEPVYAILKEVFPDVSTCRSGEACFIVKPANKPYIKNGQQERKHFPFRIKKRHFTIPKKFLDDPLLKEREIYPIKFNGIHGFYCSKIQDVKAIATQFNVKIYTSIKKTA